MARAVEVIAWWVSLGLIWVSSLNSLSTPDLVAAAVAGLPCALIGPWARRAIGVRWRPRLRWLRWLACVPRSVLTDTVRVFAALPRAAATIRTVRLAGPDEGTQAAAILLVSAAPATVVLDARPAESRLLLHSLSREKSTVERAVGG